MGISDCTQLTVRGVVAGQTHIHTLHFWHKQISLSDQGVIDEWQAGARLAYRNLFSSSDQPCQLYIARRVCGSLPLPAPVEEAEVAPNIVGTSGVTGERVPSWLAVVHSERTALAGRSRRGRFYIGGLWEAWVVGNDLDSAVLTTHRTYDSTLLSLFGPAGTSANFQLVVYSAKLASVPGTPCSSSSTAVGSILTNAPLGSMKSRKPGRGT